MSEDSQQGQKNAARDTTPLENFLGRLADDPDVAAKEYLKLQNKVEKFFEFNGIEFADEHACVVLERTASKLSETPDVANVPAYTYGVARRVLLELRRKRARQRRALAGMLRELRESLDTDPTEAQFACLERCLAEFPDNTGQIILRCFQTPWGGRRELAQELHTTPQDLSQLIFKAKPKLRACIENCLSRNLLK